MTKCSICKNSGYYLTTGNLPLWCLCDCKHGTKEKKKLNKFYGEEIYALDEQKGTDGGNNG